MDTNKYNNNEIKSLTKIISNEFSIEILFNWAIEANINLFQYNISNTLFAELKNCQNICFFKGKFHISKKINFNKKISIIIPSNDICKKIFKILKTNKKNVYFKKFNDYYNNINNLIIKIIVKKLTEQNIKL